MDRNNFRKVLLNSLGIEDCDCFNEWYNKKPVKSEPNYITTNKHWLSQGIEVISNHLTKTPGHAEIPVLKTKILLEALTHLMDDTDTFLSATRDSPQASIQVTLPISGTIRVKAHAYFETLKFIVNNSTNSLASSFTEESLQQSNEVMMILLFHRDQLESFESLSD